MGWWTWMARPFREDGAAVVADVGGLVNAAKVEADGLEPALGGAAHAARRARAFEDACIDQAVLFDGRREPGSDARLVCDRTNHPRYPGRAFSTRATRGVKMHRIRRCAQGLLLLFLGACDS